MIHADGPDAGDDHIDGVDQDPVDDQSFGVSHIDDQT